MIMGGPDCLDNVEPFLLDVREMILDHQPLPVRATRIIGIDADGKSISGPAEWVGELDDEPMVTIHPGGPVAGAGLTWSSPTITITDADPEVLKILFGGTIDPVSVGLEPRVGDVWIQTDGEAP